MTAPKPAATGRRALAALALAAASAGAQGQVPTEPRLRLSAQLAQPPATTSTAPASAPGHLADAPHWATPAGQWTPGSTDCQGLASPPWDQLGLGDALAHALCQSPALRQAIADVAEQAAGVTLGETASAPRWNASLDYSGARNFNSSGSSGRTVSAALGLSWVLFDFGQRSASLRAARQTLAAALASQGNAMLESVRELLRLYGEAAVAHAGLAATQEAEATAERTAAAAQARHEALVGSQIERLQARTALAQATLERVRAAGAWENARGALAQAMGADIAQPLRLADWERWSAPTSEMPDLAGLRQEARASHPRLRAAQAQFDGLQDRLAAVRADNRGSLAFSASAGSSRNWGAAGTGTLPAANAALVATIPIFNGREANALERQVLAQMDARSAELETTRREVDSQLWQAHQALLTSRQSLQASERLLDAADSAYRVAQGRYRSGVGAMLELLNAQSALADARRQRVTAQVESLTAQTQLALAAGRIGPPPAAGRH